MPESVSQSSSASSSGMPTQIGRYIILRKLGQGGMGAVYEAEHSKLQKRVALKVLPQEVANDPAAVARFEREMLAVGRVTHPGIVQAHDADEADGIRYLAMEMVDGYDVADVAAFYEEKAGKPIPLSVACEIVRQAAVAMQAAHDAGLVHRDLKPSNLMLSVDGTVKVLDLGLAMLDAKHGDGGGLTSTGQVMGTVDYMAPEQAAETRSVDARADVYSLGATLYRLIAGKAPYPSDRFSSMLQKLMALANAEPTPLKELRPKCPDKLVALVESAMAKDPTKRTATAADLAAALESAGDAKKLAELAGKMPKRKPIDRAAIEATHTSAREAADKAEVAGTMPGPTQPRMAVDPSVDTDNTAEATFIAQSIQADENAPTFIGAADGSDTAFTGDSPVKWERKKKPAVPKWAWGVGIAATALLVAIPFVTQGKSPPATPPSDGVVKSTTADPSDNRSVGPADSSGPKATFSVGDTITPSDGWVDLLDLVDPDKDAAAGEWLLINNALTCQSDEHAMLALPVKPVGNYELKATLIRPESAAISLPIGGLRQTSLVLDVYDRNPRTSGLERFAGKDVDEPSNPTLTSAWPSGLPPHELLVRVERVGDEDVHITAQLSGTSIVDWQGPITTLRDRETWATKDNRRLGIGGYNAPLDVTKLSIRMLSGEAHVVAALGDAMASAGDIDDQTLRAVAQSGLRFAQPTSAVDIGAIDLDLTEPFTIEMWCRPDQVDLAEPSSRIGVALGPLALKRFNTPSASSAIWQCIVGGSYFGPNNGPMLSVYEMRSSSVEAELQHVVAQWNGDEVALYINGNRLFTEEYNRGPNGEQVQSFAKQILSKVDSPELRIGAPLLPIDERQRDGSQFDGTIHQVRVSRGLRYSQNFVPSVLGSDDATLALYDLGSEPGDTLKDLSGNGHDGKIVGAEWVGEAPSQSATPFDAGLEFTDAGHHVDCGELELDPTQPLTLEMWCSVSFLPELSPKNRQVQTAVKFGPLGIKLSQLEIDPDPHLGVNVMPIGGNASGFGVSASFTTPLSEPVHVVCQWTGRNGELEMFVGGEKVSGRSRWGFQGTTFEFFESLLQSRPKSRLRLGSTYEKDTSFLGVIYQLHLSKRLIYSTDFVPTPLATNEDTIAFYNFKEGSGDVLHDSSGNGHDGKIVGAEWVRFGTTGNSSASQASLAFDGTGHVELPLFYDGSRPLTIEAVVNCRALTDKPQQIICNVEQAGVGINILPDGHLAFDYRDQAGYARIRSQEPISLATPLGITTICDSDQLRLAIDGIEVAEPVALRGKHLPSALPLTIGANMNKRKDGSIHPDERFSGSIAALRISAATRSLTDVNSPRSWTTDSDTVALYKFDEGSGDILHDSSGNGHDGKIVGAEWVAAKKPPIQSNNEVATSNGLQFRKHESCVDFGLVPLDLTKPFTVESWCELQEVRNNDLANSFQHVVTLGPYRLRVDAGKPSGAVYSFSAQADGKQQAVKVESNAPPSTNRRTHLVGQWTGKRLELYVDGIRQAGKESALGIADTPREDWITEVAASDSHQRFSIGNFLNPLGQSNPDIRYDFGGVVFQTRVSQGVRYTDDFKPANLNSDSTTVALYDFHEGEGDILHDSSGNGHDGKIVGAEWVAASASDVAANAPPPAIAPFNTAEAKAHQTAWADFLGLPVEETVELPDGQTIDFVLIPPGEFTMGSSENDIARFNDWGTPKAKNGLQSETPAHPVRLTQPFYLGTYEITHEQFQAFARTSDIDREAGAASSLTTKQHPAVNVSWYDATAFCTWLGDAIGFEVRLPTEAEWEYACRAGTDSAFYFGNNINEFDRFGRYWADPDGATRPRRPDNIGSRLPNAFGLYDMHGNAMEWCADWFADTYPSDDLAIDPTGPASGRFRVRRGGSWNFTRLDSRSASRLEGGLGYRSDSVGFRIAVPIDASRPGLVLKTDADRHYGEPNGTIDGAEPTSVRPSPTIRAAVRQHGLRFSAENDVVVTPSVEIDATSPLTIEAWVTLGPKRVDEHTPNGNMYRVATLGPFALRLRNERDNAGDSVVVTVAGIEKQHHPFAIFKKDFDWREGTTHHLALMWDGTDIQIAVDGQLGVAERRASDRNGRSFEEVMDIVRNDIAQNADEKYLAIGNRYPRFEIPDHMSGVIHQVRVSKGNRYTKPFDPASLENDSQTLALYHFNNGDGQTLRDLSGNDYHGVITGAEWVEYSALRFTGNSMVEVPGVPMPENFTAEAVIRWDGGTPGSFRDLNVFEAHKRAWIAVRTPGGERPHLASSTWNRRGQKLPSGEKPEENQLVSTTLRAGQQLHVALVKENSQLRLYQNGQLTGQLDAPDWWFDGPYEYDGLKLGERFAGEMSEFCFSSAARYTESFTPPAELITDNETLVHFDFSEGSGPTVRDRSGNGHDGRIIGAEWTSTR